MCSGYIASEIQDECDKQVFETVSGSKDNRFFYIFNESFGFYLTEKCLFIDCR